MILRRRRNRASPGATLKNLTKRWMVALITPIIILTMVKIIWMTKMITLTKEGFIE